MAEAGPEHRFGSLFQVQAADYAAARPTYSAEMYERILAYMEKHGNSGRSVVADIACGSGQASLALAGLFANVVGVDASPAQVAEAPAASNMRFVLGTAEATGLPAASCDLVTVAQALHWFDIPAFYREAARILRPAATLAIWTYTTAFITNCNAANDAAQLVYDGILAEYWDDRRKLVDALYEGVEPPAPLFAHGERHHMTLTKMWSAAQYVRLVRSWSGYNTFLRVKGITRDSDDDPAVGLARAFSEIEARGDAPRDADGKLLLRVDWTVALLLATKA